MKGHSNAVNVGRICHLLLYDCEKLSVTPWFLRVPSAANIADSPPDKWLILFSFVKSVWMRVSLSYDLVKSYQCFMTARS